MSKCFIINNVLVHMAGWLFFSWNTALLKLSEFYFFNVWSSIHPQGLSTSLVNW